MKMACSSVCGSPSSLCVQSWVSDSVAMATCSEQSGSAVSISMPRRPVVGDSYRRYVIPVAVSGGSLRKGLVSAIAGETTSKLFPRFLGEPNSTDSQMGTENTTPL